MTLSLSPPQLKQIINTSLAVQPYYTPRKFTEVVHEKPNHETLSMGQKEQTLLSSYFGHATHAEDINKVTSPTSQVAPNLPSWTPLKTKGGDGGSPASDPEAGEPMIKTAIESTMKQRGHSEVELPATSGKAAAGKNPMAGGQTRTPSDAKLSKAKKIRFDGVYIATKPPVRYKNHSSQTLQRRAPASGVRMASLVDALAHTFDANKYTEERDLLRSRATLERDDEGSTAPATDVETTATEAEDSDHLWPNTRLAHPTSKRLRVRGRAVHATENGSEVLPRERLVKRLKPIQYESNSELIDTALGTVQAPISWISLDGELDTIKNEDLDDLAQTAGVASVDVFMAVDESVHTAGSPGNSHSLPSTPVGDEWRVPVRGNPIKPAFAPYQSRGAKFKQRLDAIFGENAAVRRDRVARPRPADLDMSTPLEEPDRDHSLNVNELTASDHSSSPAEEVTSAVPSTHITSQSPDTPPADTSVDPLKKSTFGDGGEQISEWINALQRLIKGKIRFKDEDLELLSIILAEIESMKEGLNESVPMISELRHSVKQLSELHEIPFGDRNKLRRRAENVLHTWLSMGEPVP